MIGDKILRSAIASKLAYAKTTSRLSSMTHTVQLHGSNQIAYVGYKKKMDSCFINNNETGIHAYAWHNGNNSLVVAFKGSSSFGDVLNFLDSRQVEFHFRERKVKVHSGILNMFQSIEGVLTNELIDPITQKIKYITFCGHSLGGAIALLASAYYGNISNKNISITCHTFGSPKVGDDEFNKWLIDGTSEVVNLVNDGDVIPSLPLLQGYYNNDVVIMKRKVLFNDPLHRHDLETYIKIIRELLELQKAPKKPPT